MRIIMLSIILVTIYACGSAKSAPSQQKETGIDATNIDTCFYEINPAADLDVPGTPAWDTAINRSKDCDVQVLKMRSWGTETQYNMSGPDNKGTITRECHFTGGEGIIDITGIPAGNYSFGLFACGNGGSFSVKIQ